MKILIIGGSRFIGLATTIALRQAGHEIAIFNRGQTLNDLPSGITRITGDVNRLDESREALQAFAPEIVWHNIVLNEGHIRQTQRIFDGIARRLIMTSSIDVYLHFGRLLGTEPGPVSTDEVDEDSPLRTVLFPYRTPEMPTDARLYDYDKIPAEQAALSHPSLPATVLRLPMTIGEHDPARRLLDFVQPMRDQRPFLVLDEARAHWISPLTHVENAAAAVTLAVSDDRSIGRTYNVIDGYYSTLTVAEQVKLCMNWPGEIISVPTEALPDSLRFNNGAPPQDLRIKAERIRRELGYAPVVDFAESIQRSVAWELNNPPETLPAHLADYTPVDAVLKALGK